MLWRSSIFSQGRSIVRVCESLSKLHEYISSSELKLPSSTVSLEEDLKVSIYCIPFVAIFDWVSTQYRIVWSYFTSLYDWARKLAPSSHPIRYQTETNYDSVTCVFPRFSRSFVFTFWLAVVLTFGFVITKLFWHTLHCARHSQNLWFFCTGFSRFQGVEQEQCFGQGNNFLCYVQLENS